MQSFALTCLKRSAVWLALVWPWASLSWAPALVLAGQAREVVGPSGDAQPLTVLSQDGRAHSFVVELADSQALRELGLMFREELPPDYAMLFDFEQEQNLVMWMKDTPLSLDMFFADSSGLIFHIAENTVPFSEDLIAAPWPGRYVLEASAGTAKRLGLQPGDMMPDAPPLMGGAI